MFDYRLQDAWATTNVIGKGLGGGDILGWLYETPNIVDPATVKPEISVPQLTYIITLGDSWAPPVGFVSDNIDGYTTPTITGTYDVNTLGSYLIYYNATDTDSNPADQVVVTLIVIAPIVSRDSLVVPYELNTSHPLYANIVSALAIGADGASTTAVQGANATQGTSGGAGYGLSSDTNTTAGWSFPDATPISSLAAYSVFTYFHLNDFSGVAEDVLYGERPNVAQILKTTIKGNSFSFVSRNSGGTGLINNATAALLDETLLLHTSLFVRNNSASREVYADANYSFNTTAAGGDYSNVPIPRLLVDPQDAAASNGRANILLNLTFNKGLTSEDYLALQANPWSIFLVDGGADTTKPVITVPQLTYTITEGDSFAPPLGTVTDNVDTTTTITHTGTYDVNTAGTYYLYYNATDTAGNVAETVTVTLVVEAVGGTTALQFNGTEYGDVTTGLWLPSGLTSAGNWSIKAILTISDVTQGIGIFGIPANYSNSFTIREEGAVYFGMGGASLGNYLISADGVVTNGTRTIEIRKVNGLLKLFVDNIFIVDAPEATGASDTPNFTRVGITSAASKSSGVKVYNGAYQLEMLTVSGNAGVKFDWRPSLSSGTGYTLYDNVGTNNISLVGYADATSHWIGGSAGVTKYGTTNVFGIGAQTLTGYKQGLQSLDSLAVSTSEFIGYKDSQGTLSPLGLLNFDLHGYKQTSNTTNTFMVTILNFSGEKFSSGSASPLALITHNLLGYKQALGPLLYQIDGQAPLSGYKQALGSLPTTATAQAVEAGYKLTSGPLGATAQVTVNFNGVLVAINVKTGSMSVSARGQVTLEGYKKALGPLNAQAYTSSFLAGLKSVGGEVNIAGYGDVTLTGYKTAYGALSAYTISSTLISGIVGADNLKTGQFMVAAGSGVGFLGYKQGVGSIEAQTSAAATLQGYKIAFGQTQVTSTATVAINGVVVNENIRLGAFAVAASLTSTLGGFKEALGALSTETIPQVLLAGAKTSFGVLNVLSNPWVNFLGLSGELDPHLTRLSITGVKAATIIRAVKKTTVLRGYV